jgi:hypothetical protein
MNRDSIIGLVAAFLTLAFLFFHAPSTEESPADALTSDGARPVFAAAYGTPIINGVGDDLAWESAEWLPLDQVWLGQPPTPSDFSGRYKLLWDENNLYVLAEITDDTLVDIQPDGLLKYWDDDCLEIFVDEDASGGNHQYNYNAFAYHIALDGHVADIRPDSAFAYFDEHCTTRRTTIGQTSFWEIAVKIFDGNRYTEEGENIPKMLKTNKKMGFMLAYCDNDHSAARENFIGSVPIEGADKNNGWIDASIFGLLELNEALPTKN